MPDTRVVLAAAGVLLLVAGVLLWLVLGQEGSDGGAGPTSATEADELTALVLDFNEAVQRQPVDALPLMCAEEREPARLQLADDLPDTPSDQIDAVEVGEVVVRGEVASVEVTPATGVAGTLYFRREQGAWTVCAPARSEFERAGGAGS